MMFDNDNPEKVSIVISNSALNTELAKMALEQRHASIEHALQRKASKSLIKQIKAELPQTVRRQQKAGWPNATPERVVVPGLWRPSRTVGLTLVCGNPLSVPLAFNSHPYGFWLGTDGRLYAVNSCMWTNPKPNTEPYWKLEYRDVADIDKLENLLHGLTFL